MSEGQQIPGRLKVIRHIRLGGFEVDLLEDGTLRSVNWEGTEILSAVYAAVRDHNWATVPAVVTIQQMDEDDANFKVLFDAEHRDKNVDFRWQGIIELNVDGTLKYGLEGEAVSDFRKNRIGFCLFHPLTMAGNQVRVVTPAGICNTVFPERISPQDPFVGFNKLEMAVNNRCTVSIAFEGDLFQTEDQRNWTDGSYKTFCTPLNLPYPVQMQAGDKVTQKISVHVETLSSSELPTRSKVISVGAQSYGKLPRLGTTFSPESTKLAPKEEELHRKAAWADLRAVISLEEEDWSKKLSQAYAAAVSMMTKLHIELIVPYTTPYPNGLAQELCACKPILDSVSIYPSRLEGASSPVRTVCELSGASHRATQYTTSEELLSGVRNLIAEHGITAAVGGGSRGNFAEWNRTVLPFHKMDFTEFAMNPQVHASDVLSMVESLPAQALAVQTAQARIAGLPVHVSSVTLKPEFNPYASDDKEVLASADRSSRYDARLHSNFAASWTIASISRISLAGASAARYFEHAGSLGMMDDKGGRVYPVFRVFTELADMREAELLPVDCRPQSFAALALRKGDRLRLLVAELSGDEEDVIVDCSALGVEWKMAEARTLEGIDGIFEHYLLDSGGTWKLKLAPFSVVILDTELAGGE